MTARLQRWYKIIDLEKGLIVGSLLVIAGAVLLGLAMLQWKATGFGDLDYSSTMRVVIPGVTLVAIGFQTVLSSFFLSVLGMQRPSRRLASGGQRPQA